MKLLIDSGVKINEDAYKDDNEIYTALGLAIKYENIEIVKVLLDHKAGDVGVWEIKNDVSYYALGYAMNCNNTEIVKLLLEHGLNPNTAKSRREKKGDIDILASDDIIDREDIKLLEIFFSYGLKSENVLIRAIKCGNPEIVKIVLEHFKDFYKSKMVYVLTGTFDEYITLDGEKYFVGTSRSPLAYAIECNNMEIVKLLLDYGAPWSSVNTNFVTRIRLKRKVEAKIKEICK